MTWSGQGGIRTREGLETPTRFPGVRLKPLGHPSKRGSNITDALLRKRIHRTMARWILSLRQVAYSLWGVRYHDLDPAARLRLQRHQLAPANWSGNRSRRRQDGGEIVHFRETNLKVE